MRRNGLVVAMNRERHHFAEEIGFGMKREVDGLHRDPFRGNSFVSRPIEAARGHHQGGLYVRRGKRVIAARHSAGDLQVDDAVAHAIAVEAFAHDDSQRSIGHGHWDAKLMQRAAQARDVALLVDDMAVADLADLVDTIGELVAAILDMDHGLSAGKVSSIHIGAAHQQVP